MFFSQLPLLSLLFISNCYISEEPDATNASAHESMNAKVSTITSTLYNFPLH